MASHVAASKPASPITGLDKPLEPSVESFLQRSTSPIALKDRDVVHRLPDAMRSSRKSPTRRSPFNKAAKAKEARELDKIEACQDAHETEFDRGSGNLSSHPTQFHDQNRSGGHRAPLPFGLDGSVDSVSPGSNSYRSNGSVLAEGSWTVKSATKSTSSGRMRFVEDMPKLSQEVSRRREKRHNTFS